MNTNRQLIKATSEKIELTIPTEFVNSYLEIIINSLPTKTEQYSFKRARELTASIKGNLSDVIIEERDR